MSPATATSFQADRSSKAFAEGVTFHPGRLIGVSQVGRRKEGAPQTDGGQIHSIKTWKSLGRGMRGASRGGRKRGREAGGTDLGQAVPTVNVLAPEAEDF